MSYQSWNSDATEVKKSIIAVCSCADVQPNMPTDKVAEPISSGAKHLIFVYQFAMEFTKYIPKKDIYDIKKFRAGSGGARLSSSVKCQMMPCRIGR